MAARIGPQRAFLISALLLLAAAAIALLAGNPRAGEHADRLELVEARPEEA